jgi:hypothetical protein
VLSRMNNQTFPFYYSQRFRKLHGALSVIGTFFLTPVAIFVGRNYKESFLGHHILYQPVWLMASSVLFVGIRLKLYPEDCGFCLGRFTSWGRFVRCLCTWWEFTAPDWQRRPSDRVGVRLGRCTALWDGPPSASSFFLCCLGAADPSDKPASSLQSASIR